MTVFLLALAAVAVHATMADVCKTTEWGKCNGPNNEVLCCPPDFYCQPWAPTIYQCLQQPKPCFIVDTNYDYVGNDIAKYFLLTPDECARRCQQHRGECWVFTFVNQRANHPSGACYLKSVAAVAAKNKTFAVGAITGVC